MQITATRRSNYIIYRSLKGNWNSVVFAVLYPQERLQSSQKEKQCNSGLIYSSA